MNQPHWSDAPPPIGERHYWELQGDTWVYQGPGIKMWATIGDWELHTYDRHLDIEDIEEEEPVLYDPNDPVDNAPPAVRIDRLGSVGEALDA
jgi:hypothetical protein